MRQPRAKDTCPFVPGSRGCTRTPLVLATTGLTEEQESDIGAAAQQIPLVWAPNMSMAVNLTMKLAEVAGRALQDNPSGADVEIIERHHRYKQDAPSGTALRFGELLAQIDVAR